jgi:23S rRNA pseudouridine1911/1915/1917 synthase
MSTDTFMEQMLEEGDFEQVNFVVDNGQKGIRLDHFLASRLAKVSRNRIQNAIHAGLVLVNEKNCKPNNKIKPNDIIMVHLPRVADDYEIIPEEMSLNIVFEDEYLLVVHKPPGIVVHPAAGNSKGTLVNGLAYYFKQKGMEQESSVKSRVGLVHRIDKETSGLLLIAKDEFTHAQLAKQFFEHTIDREYIALVWGEPEPLNGTITGNIGRDPRNRQRMHVFPEGLEGKHAITHYEVLESFYFVSLVRCRLETGRTHQIRVHMRYKGHPLFNDARYDGDQIMKGTIFTKYKQFIQNCYKILPRFALHARSLGFIHPHTGEKMIFEYEIPEDFTLLLNKWREYTKHRKDILEED